MDKRWLLAFPAAIALVIGGFVIRADDDAPPVSQIPVLLDDGTFPVDPATASRVAAILPDLVDGEYVKGYLAVTVGAGPYAGPPESFIGAGPNAGPESFTFSAVVGEWYGVAASPYEKGSSVSLQVPAGSVHDIPDLRVGNAYLVLVRDQGDFLGGTTDSQIALTVGGQDALLLDGDRVVGVDSWAGYEATLEAFAAAVDPD